MHRGPNVRSVPNTWSFPTGMHEIGESLYSCGRRELREELNLEAIRGVVLGAYDNIPGDGYHWMIIVMLVLVESFDDMVNNEPDKHDILEIVSQYELTRDDFFVDYPFHPSFVEWFKGNFRRVLNTILVGV